MDDDNFLGTRFKTWPGQQSLIETTFRQPITSAMKAFDPNYADWMVTVTYRASINLEDNVPSRNHERANGLISSSSSRE